mmetsp:Transcript_9787/g.23078  ORF Transcript_9787/g.23078 Transcript_9787/m.23078 type:complete len:346 (+) Transcript_9787:349-1386(+)
MRGTAGPINRAMLMRQSLRLFSAPAVSLTKKHAAGLDSSSSWPAGFTTADIGPCGTLRGASALRLFDVPCVKRIPGVMSAVEAAKGEDAGAGKVASAKIDAFCVGQSFNIRSQADMKAPVAGRLLVEGYSKSSVRFLGVVTQPESMDAHGEYAEHDEHAERVVAVCRRTFVRVKTRDGKTTSAPYTEEERAVLEADVATTGRIIERFVASVPDGAAFLTDSFPGDADAATVPQETLEALEAIFTQRVLPHHMNVGGHIDHGYLTDMAHDAAVLARMQEGGSSKAATCGRVSFMNAGALGDEVQCLAYSGVPGVSHGTGAVSSIQLESGGAQEGNARELCRAVWAW